MESHTKRNIIIASSVAALAAIVGLSLQHYFVEKTTQQNSADKGNEKEAEIEEKEENKK